MTNITKARTCYIDDDAGELNRIAGLLERTSKLSVKPYLPSSWLSDDASRRKLYDLYLVDYELSKATADSGPIAHTGNLLAAYIRELASEYPIVLLTKTSLIEPATRDEHLSNYPLLDDIIYKDDLDSFSQTQEVAHRLLQLAVGYSEIRRVAESMANWNGILLLLQAEAQDREWLALAQPPLHQTADGARWRTSPLARWITQVFLEFPGIVLDPLYAATSLQISTDAFLSREVQHIFGRAKYTGVFADLSAKGYWWASRLEQIALEYTETTDYAERFGSVFQTKEGIPLEAAKSIVKSDLPGNSVCHVLREPVRFEYTLAYRPDNRPAIMLPARISFKAIQERNDVPTEFIEDADAQRLNNIRKMRL